MHTKKSLMLDLENLGIDQNGILLIHSSYKSIGDVEGRADTVIDALMEYMKKGTLIIPTHTWDNIGINKEDTMDVLHTPVCIGIIPELFRKREGVIRTLHPTHSVGIYGKNAKELADGEEKVTTPCGRNSIMGKLLDNQGTIVLIGVGFTRNTFIHGVEEWNNVPNRLTKEPHQLYVRTATGEKISTPQYRHCADLGSETYYKLEPIMKKTNVLKEGYFGDSVAKVCDAKKLNDVLSKMLSINIDLLSDHQLVDENII